MPTSVARTGGNLPNGAFIPEIWAQRLNDKYYAQCFLPEITNSNYTGNITGKGGSVKIRNRPTVQINKHVVGAPIKYQDITDTFVELFINQANEFAFQIDDVDAAQSDINIMNELTIDASYQAKIAVEIQVLGSIYGDAGVVLPSTAITSVNVLSWLIQAEVALEKANTPPSDRWVILPPEIGGMIQLSDLKNVYMTGDAKTILRGEMSNGRIGMIGSMEVYISNNLTTIGGVTQCLAGHKSAVTYASQFTNLKTLTLQDYHADAIRGLNVFGFKTLIPGALVSLPATYPSIGN